MSLRERTRGNRPLRRAAVLAVAAALTAFLIVRAAPRGGSSDEVRVGTIVGSASAPAEGKTIHDHPAPDQRDPDVHSAIERPVDTRSAHIEITATESLDVQSHVPGDINGPGVAITVRITNRSPNTLSLDNVTVDLIDSQGRPASPVSLDGYEPLSGSFGPGKPATGRYVFTIAQDDRDGAQISITYGPAPEPTVIFTGGLPHA